MTILMNSLFAKLIKKGLGTFHFTITLTYMDDELLSNVTVGESLDNFRVILTVLRGTNLKLNYNDAIFLKDL